MTTASQILARPTTAPQERIANLGRALFWPVLGLLLTGTAHFMLEALWPDLRTTFVPAVLGPVLLAYGAWAGYRATWKTGSYAMGVLAAALLGLLPLMLDVVGFGIVLDRGTTAGVLAGLFGWSFVVFGGLLGSGVQRSFAR